jgi:hypothetical protein
LRAFPSRVKQNFRPHKEEGENKREEKKSGSRGKRRLLVVLFNWMLGDARLLVGRGTPPGEATVFVCKCDCVCDQESMRRCFMTFFSHIE